VILDEHGLDPYWGLVSQFEPDLSDSLDPLKLLGDRFELETSSYWTGKIADPNGDRDGGLYEYKLALWTDDEAGDRGADFTFRPGYPNAEHCETGEEISGIPSDCPESLRIQIEATNLERDQVLELHEALFEAIDLSTEYVSEPHDWSSIYALECYARIERAEAVRSLVGADGVLEHLSQFSLGRGRGAHKWDHEEISGHYEAVSLDPDSWDRLIDDHEIAKRLKCYQPDHVRSDDNDDDPLYHHKIEAQYWSDYQTDSLSWSAYQTAVDELRSAVLNPVDWAGIDLDPDSGPWEPDPYWTPQRLEEPIEIVPNPIPDLKDERELDARRQLIDPDATATQFEVLEQIADGGTPLEYDELAERSDTSTSTVYRAIEQFDQIIEIETGSVHWKDDVVRETISSIVERFQSNKERAVDALERVAEKATPLSRWDDDEPSALEQWANRHGIRLRESYEHGLEIEIDQPVSRRKLEKLLRAGLRAAERSSILTRVFEDARLDWKDLDGFAHKNWKPIGAHGRILGSEFVD